MNTWATVPGPFPWRRLTHWMAQVHTEEEIQKILPIARKHEVPVTFRAAGTSLSGQALTDSVLLKLSHTGRNFRNYEIHVSLSTKPAPGVGYAVPVLRVRSPAILLGTWEVSYLLLFKLSKCLPRLGRQQMMNLFAPGLHFQIVLLVCYVLMTRR